MWNITESSFCLKSLFPLVERQFKRHFGYAEGFLLKLLQNHTCSSVSSKDLADLLAHLHTPIIYLYIIALGFVFSVFAIPCVCCLGACIKKTIDANKYQCCFPVEIMFYIIFTLCLLIGVIGAYQATLFIQEGLFVLPPLWRGLVDDVVRTRADFQRQLHHLIDIVDNSCGVIIERTLNIPDEIVGMMVTELDPNLNEAVIRMNSNVFIQEYMFRSSFYVEFGERHPIQISAEQLQLQMGKIYTILSKLQKSEPDNWIYKWNVTDTVFMDNLKFPDWQAFYHDLHLLRTDLMTANKSLFFMEQMHANIRNNCAIELHKTVSAARYLQDLSVAVEQNITCALKGLFPQKIKRIILDTTCQIDRYLSSMSYSRDFRKYESNGNTWAMLIPTILAAMMCGILTVSFLFSLGELKRIIVHSLAVHSAISVGHVLKSFRISMVFIVSILWMFFVITGMFFTLYLFMSVFCRTLYDGKIFSEYLDKPSVWHNKTWLSYHWHKYNPNFAHELKLRKILKECSSRTVYDLFHVQEFWTLHRHDPFNIQINITGLHENIAKAIAETKLPNEPLSKLTKGLETVTENLNLDFVSLLLKNVHKFYRDRVESRLTEIIDTLPHGEVRESLQELLQAVRIHVRYVFSSCTEMMQLRNNIRILHEEMVRINALVFDFPERINQTVRRLVYNNILQPTAANVHNLALSLKILIENNARLNIGNCSALPGVYDTATWSCCTFSLSIATGAWLAFGIISISALMALILSCRVAGYIRGFNVHYCIWRAHLENQRYSSDTTRPLNNQFLFDRAGNYMGSSLAMKPPSRHKAVDT